MDQTKTVVTISGKRYTLCGTESADYIQRVALKVNDKIEELRSAHPDMPNIDLALLTAINLADDYMKCHDELEAAKKDLAARATTKKAPASKSSSRSNAKKQTT